MRWLQIPISIVLLGLLVVYSGGLTIEKHFCRAELVDLAINGTAERCSGSESFEPVSNQPVFKKKSCCRTEFASFQLDQQLNSTALQIEVETAELPQTFNNPNFNYGQFSSRIWKLANPPPLDKSNIYRMFERYLI